VQNQDCCRANHGVSNLDQEKAFEEQQLLTQTLAEVFEILGAGSQSPHSQLLLTQTLAEVFEILGAGSQTPHNQLQDCLIEGVEG
jgi:hypothetical protein